MKQICTLIAFSCAVLLTSKTFAQNSVDLSTTFPSPAPTPSFGSTDSVNLANGFTNTTGTITDFPKNKTTTITSPSYYYPTSQSTIYFIYNLKVATAGSTTTIPQLSIIAPNGTFAATAEEIIISGTTGVNYYFTFHLGSPLPPFTNFKVALTMSIDNNDKVVEAHTLTTNAFHGPAPVNSSIPMPVKFAGFFAKEINTGIALTWNVGVEENLSGYEIQKSIDGTNFSKIGFVSANNLTAYSFTDAKSSSAAYYRIRSVDNDGKYSYSTIVSIKGQQSSVVIKAFPSPVQNMLTIQHNSFDKQSMIELVSIDGKVIKSITAEAHSQQTNVDLSKAKPGIYIVRLIDQGEVASLKIVKQ
jgi:hypothetical protein